MNTLSIKRIYNIDEELLEVNLDAFDNYKFGDQAVLSEKYLDLTKNMEWYDQGYDIVSSDGFYSREAIYFETSLAIKKIIKGLDSGINLVGFTLEKYHNYVSDELHNEVMKKSRTLFPRDLGFDTKEILKKFSKYLGSDLTFLNPITNTQQHMIARINKPESHHYNTAHKDIYNSYDEYGYIPRMVNIWIPLCGVTKYNGLPIVPGSHLISENKIKRSKAGSTMNSLKFNVNSILSWNGQSKLTKAITKPNDFLIFSSHLIHGLAFNNNKDQTRISFEFRFFEKA